MNEKEDWGFLKQIKDEIEDHLCEREGTITIEQREDKFVLCAMIPKDGNVKVQLDDLSHCLYISE